MLNNYKKLENGVIKQKEIVDSILLYDYEYIETRYNSYGKKGLQMAYLRLGILLGVIGKTPNSILDVGYGNGDFLKVCNYTIPNCFGYDISNYSLPDGIEYASDITSDHYDVICFFDSLEHFKSISFIENIKCDYVYISLPWCHYKSNEWFSNWKHRRVDEHLWHFNDISLDNFFSEFGYSRVYISSAEDIIRKPVDNLPNILTSIFKKDK